MKENNNEDQYNMEEVRRRCLIVHRYKKMNRNEENENKKLYMLTVQGYGIDIMYLEGKGEVVG